MTRRLSLEPAARVREAVSRLPALPLYVHKWTRSARAYTPADLLIPDEVSLVGEPLDWSLPRVGVGGTRSPTVETFCTVQQVVRALSARSAVIVSGGVPGVDLAAHMAALDAAGGKTYAVMANPAPARLSGHEWSSALVEDAIIATGGFLSEYDTLLPVGSPEYRERLLQRDRIISGVSSVFVAFECSSNSATIDTLWRARAQGVPIVAVRSAVEVRTGLNDLVAAGVTCLDARGSPPDRIADAILELARADG